MPVRWEAGGLQNSRDAVNSFGDLIHQSMELVLKPFLQILRRSDKKTHIPLSKYRQHDTNCSVGCDECVVFIILAQAHLLSSHAARRHVCGEFSPSLESKTPLGSALPLERQHADHHVLLE